MHPIFSYSTIRASVSSARINQFCSQHDEVIAGSILIRRRTITVTTINTETETDVIKETETDVNTDPEIDVITETETDITSSVLKYGTVTQNELVSGSCGLPWGTARPGDFRLLSSLDLYLIKLEISWLQ